MGQRLAGGGQGGSLVHGLLREDLCGLEGGEGRSWAALWGDIKQGGGNNRCQLLIQECASVFPEKLEGREPGRVQWWNKVQAVS